MPAPATTPAPAGARPSRYLTSGQTPRRGELTAGIATLAVLAHLLLAQVTLVLTAVARFISRSTGWRPGWLAAPAGAGLVWALAIGPGAAVSGLLAGPRQVAAYFAGVPAAPGRILRPQHAFAGAGHWLPRQLPLALILAAGEVAAGYWLDHRRADERVTSPRPGLLVALRRRWTTATIAVGGATTRDGGWLGLDAADGRPAVLTWAEAAGGVLCAGPAGSLTEPGPDDLLAQTCFRLVQAAVRRRKPVIVIDLAGRDWIGPALASACTDAGAPLRVLSPDGPGSYEPFRGGDPAQAAALVTGMADWAAAGEPHRAMAGGALTAALGLLTAAPGESRPALLDELAGLLRPGALRARLSQVPAYHPRRAVLAAQVAQVTEAAGPDQAGLASLAAQLAALRSSPLGRWLAPGPERISVSQTVRDRAAVLFSLGTTKRISVGTTKRISVGTTRRIRNADPPGGSGPGEMAGPPLAKGGPERYPFAGNPDYPAQRSSPAHGGSDPTQPDGAQGNDARPHEAPGFAARVSEAQVLEAEPDGGWPGGGQADWARHDWASWDRPARMIASLAASDLIATCAELGKTGVPADALAWVHGCEAVPAALLRELVAAGSRAGLAVMLSTESAGVAAQLADTVNVVVACGPDGLETARRYARLIPAAPNGDHPAGPEPDHRPYIPLPAQYVRPRRRLRPARPPAGGRFTIAVKRPERLQPHCEGIPVPHPAVSP
jgi:hypothetical protein